MSTKTTKRKRANAAEKQTSAPAAEPAPVAPVVAAPAVEVAMTPGAEAASEPTIALASNCTVKDAADLKDALLQMLEESSVVIDAKSVERIDTATAQLLCAFVRDRAERNLAVTWRGVPHALRDAVRLLGVGSLLALPAEAAS